MTTETKSPQVGREAEAEARRVAEAAREEKWKGLAFMRDIFMGKFDLDLVHPYPDPEEAIGERAREIMKELDVWLRDGVDPDQIDRDRKIPEDVFEGLRKRGLFGIKTPEKYGGLGLHQMEYGRIMTKIASRDVSVASLLSAHQSIGIPQPMKLFGTEEQKEKFLTRTARGDISAFALTEADVGSDPGKLQTKAELSEDGEAYILNGEKLWTTNGTVASVILVMARTSDKKITAFIVETDSPGVEVIQRCHFMGINAIENAVITLKDVRVPKENILWGLGKGLKLALITLNTGRLTVVAIMLGSVKSCLEIARHWAARRVQWGQPVGKHDAVAQMIADLASHAFAMEAVCDLTALMADRGGYDFRLEAAAAKLLVSELGWEMIDKTMQICGGRGYEKPDSLKERGEPPMPVERIMRDFRINRIFEGSSEILRLFMARQAVDKHLKVAGQLVEGNLSFFGKLKELPKVAWFYTRWYPASWVGWGHWPKYQEWGKLAKHVRWADRTSRRLARAIFHLMARHGDKLQRRGMLLFRAVDVGSELFAATATLSRAKMLRDKGAKDAPEAEQLADHFCRRSRERVRELFRGMRCNADVVGYETALKVLEGGHAWVEDGIVRLYDEKDEA